MTEKKGPSYHVRLDLQTSQTVKQLRQKYEYPSTEALLMDAARVLLAMTNGEELPQWAKEGRLPNGAAKKNERT